MPAAGERKGGAGHRSSLQAAERRAGDSAAPAFSGSLTQINKCRFTNISRKNTGISAGILALGQQESKLNLFDHNREQPENMFQTFRQYREMFEQQKAVLEQRYRSLLEDAIQDAVFLSTRNSELMQENQAMQHGASSMWSSFK